METTCSSELYACDTMRAVTGDTVRPGGLSITRKAIDFCGLPAGASLLDVGCGTGASVEFLIKEYEIKATGIDPSQTMLALGKKRNADLPLISGKAEELPFADHTMDAVLSECCFSHFSDINKAIQEFYRVLSPEGWLIITDMYIKPNPSNTSKVTTAVSVNTFMDKDTVLHYIDKHGFRIMLWEDHTHELKQLAIDIIMQYGSMTNFWKAASCSCNNCFASENKDTKLGYYLLMARKK